MNIVVQHTISMGHRLQHYNGICSSLHGHNVVVEAHFTSGKDFLDFKLLQEHLKEVLADFDHAMVLEANDPIVAALKMYKVRIVQLSQAPTTENIAAYVLNTLYKILPETFAVKVHETEKYSASTSIKEPYTDVRRVE
jgi:6-pyruvoyltetrahydropterin/6-carboxytetrahydropterin synthase